MNQIFKLERESEYSEIIKRSKNSKYILEIGVGDGFGIDKFLNEGFIVYCLDIDIDKLILNQVRGAYCYWYDGGKFPFLANSFDVISLNHTIEHIPNLQEFLREIKRVLKPNGILVGATPNGKWLDDYKKPLNKEHVIEFTFDLLRKELEKVFDEVEIFSFGPANKETEKVMDDFYKKKATKSTINKINIFNIKKIIPLSLRRFILNRFKNTNVVNGDKNNKNNLQSKKLKLVLGKDDKYNLFFVCKKIKGGSNESKN